MNRHYFITDDLDDLQIAVAELKQGGLTDPQLHVLSRDDAAVATRPDLNPVEAVLKKNVVRGTEIGAVIGVAGAGLVLGITYFSGVSASIGWVPFLFLALVVLGFCTWEGGLFGIQESHADFSRFEKQLDLGKHVFFVDQPGEREELLHAVMERHPKCRPAGKGSAAPELVVEARKKFNHAMQTLP